MTAAANRPAWPTAALTALLLALSTCPAQPKAEVAPVPSFEAGEGDRRARALLSGLLADKPEAGLTNTATLKIRGADDRVRLVPVRIEIRLTPTNWANVYATEAAGDTPAQELVIVHTDGAPNQYWLTPPSATNAPPRPLGPTELMTPFGGSDFWVVDLGLEFLHWPGQRALKQQMRKGLTCDVLQSSNPHPLPDGYARVASWIAVNRPEEIVIVHAEAFDASGNLLKQFDPKKVQKVNGVWQLEEMEIRNRPAGTRTRIEFKLDD